MDLVDAPRKQINLVLNSAATLNACPVQDNICSIRIGFEETPRIQCKSLIAINSFVCSKWFPRFLQVCNLVSLSFDVDGDADLSNIRGLVTLSVGGYEDNFTLRGYEHLTSLKFVDISNCCNIEDIRCWENVESLQLLNCPRLRYIPTKNISSLNIENCPLLEEELEDENLGRELGAVTSLSLSWALTNQIVLQNLVSLNISLADEYSPPTKPDDLISQFFGSEFPALPKLEEIFLRNFYFSCLYFDFQSVPGLLNLTLLHCYAKVNVTGLVNLVNFSVLAKESFPVQLVGVSDLIRAESFVVSTQVMDESVVKDYLHSFTVNPSRSVALSIQSHVYHGDPTAFPLGLEAKDQYPFLQRLELRLIGKITEVVVPTSVTRFHIYLSSALEKIIFPQSAGSEKRIVQNCTIDRCEKLQLIQVSRKILKMSIVIPAIMWLPQPAPPRGDLVIDCRAEEGGQIVNLLNQ